MTSIVHVVRSTTATLSPGGRVILSLTAGPLVEHHRVRHHVGSNLAQYHYVERKYGKHARAQVFFATALLVMLLLGSIVVVQLGETDVQRKARVQDELVQ
jgi:hypothetical protein